MAARRADLQQVMWESAGIVRSQATMKAALDRLASAYVETKALAEGYGLTTELIELQNLVTVSPPSSQLFSERHSNVLLVGIRCRSKPYLTGFCSQYHQFCLFLALNVCCAVC